MQIRISFKFEKNNITVMMVRDLNTFRYFGVMEKKLDNKKRISIKIFH